MMTKRKPPRQKQTFSYKAAGAMSVLLAGDFTKWQEEALPMKQTRKDLWQKTLELEPGIYHYRFIVDGRWQNDPECILRIPNPYGGEDCVRHVS